MTQTTLKKLITSGIKDLPVESLREIADFVLLLRVKTLDKSAKLKAMIVEELKKLDKTEALHLEKEFQNYEALHPKEEPAFGKGLTKGPIPLPPGFDEPLENYPPGFGGAKGMFVMSPDFDEPLEDFKEYMY